MKREEAVDVIRQILDRCAYFKSLSLLLNPHNPDNCEICIEMTDTDVIQSCIEKIARENGLTVNKDGTFLKICRQHVK